MHVRNDGFVRAYIGKHTYVYTEQKNGQTSLYYPKFRFWDAPYKKAGRYYVECMSAALRTYAYAHPSAIILLK